MTTVYGQYALRSGRQLLFEGVEYVETEIACFHTVSLRPDGKRYEVRVPMAATLVLLWSLLSYLTKHAPNELAGVLERHARGETGSP